MKQPAISIELRQKFREIRGALSQKEFAKRVGVNRALICCYESGKRSPSFASLKKIAKYGGVSVGYLSGEEEGPLSNATAADYKTVQRFGKLSPESKALVTELIKRLK
jgi:transcriptional regulator with XRE-family HTH domain